jgi:hypothetical protein
MGCVAVFMRCVCARLGVDEVEMKKPATPVSAGFCVESGGGLGILAAMGGYLGCKTCAVIAWFQAGRSGRMAALFTSPCASLRVLRTAKS